MKDEDMRSDCCCADIYIVGGDYGICSQCHTRIGFHHKKDDYDFQVTNTTNNQER